MSEKPPRIMIAGATGYIGGGVLQVLHQKGFWIRALCRDKGRLRNPDWCDDIFVGHATRPETLKGLCEGIDIVFSSIGIRSFKRKPTIWEVDYQGNLNILQEAKHAGVKHFIFVSVLRGSEMARLSPVAAARERVAQAIIESGMDYNIFAPTGFFNDEQVFLAEAQQKGVVRLIGEGSGVINPLSALDFGEEVVKVIEDPELRNQVKPVGGCEKFSHRQIAELAFQVIGKEPRIKTISAWRLALLALLLRPFNYNAYTLIKFFEFIARTPDMTGEPIGRRRLEDFFRNLTKGLSIAEADSAL
ncbi:MAG: SDR family oxidoreductase [Leptolyngbyaceae cyanobacterium MO_188.B28]|nr:SDR family oxidoreductase [Leptolyngbyaceae cyanobacterium MO_188.B28]